MENVSALVSGKFIKLFNRWQLTLERLGYKNFAKVLDAKDHGVPQHRERIFLISILDPDARFEFPKPRKLDIRLKDILEPVVDEKYYLSKTIVQSYINETKRNKEKGNGFGFEPTDGGGIAKSVLTKAGSRKCDNYIEEADECE